MSAIGARLRTIDMLCRMLISSRRSSGIAIAILAAALSLTACSSSSIATACDQLQDELLAVNGFLDRAGEIASANPQGNISRPIQTLQDGIREAASNIRVIQGPEEFSSVMKEASASAERLANTLGQLAVAINTGSSAKYEEFRSNILEISAENAVLDTKIEKVCGEFPVQK